MIEDAWEVFPQVDWKEASPENHDIPEHWRPLPRITRDDNNVTWPKLIGEHPGDWE